MNIDKSILNFLSQLKKNNEKPWFESHKTEFRACQEKYNDFCNGVLQQLSKTDQLEGVKVFRIYRDVRFSNDKTPYKTNFGAAFSRLKPYLRGGYYLHIEPGNSFVGGGFWDPDPADVKRIREEIAADARPLQKIQASKTFVEYFGEISGDQLKTMPRGFDASLPGEDLIRRKQYLVMRKFADKAVLADGFDQEVVKTFKTMRPFFDYMTMVLTTDSNGESLLK
jgi:uncharacterized protein (TIGR02453 family)